MLNDKDYDDFLAAGKLAGRARDYGAKLIKVDASLEEVTDAVEEFIIENGGQMAFPAQLSRNQIAAHYCAGKDDPMKFEKGDLVKLDVGVHIKGMIGDTAITVDLGRNESLLNASKEALANAIKMLEPGIENGIIGKEIEKTITGYGFSPVNNLSGHGLGKFQIHTKPSIPNFYSGDTFRIEPGTTFAIEPFASAGAGYVVEGHDAEVFGLEQIKPVRSPITRNVLSEIRKYNGLPFCGRWLANKFGKPRVNFALRELMNIDSVRMYPPLSDRNNGFVSQHEHSVLMEEDKAIITTK
ncbi:MAG: type II methionyl aminopeptidase [Candidatus Woesearchaeota archaeon]